MTGQPNESDRHAQEREILPKKMQDLAQYVQEGKFEDCIIFFTGVFQGLSKGCLWEGPEVEKRSHQS